MVLWLLLLIRKKTYLYLQWSTWQYPVADPHKKNIATTPTTVWLEPMLPSRPHRCCCNRDRGNESSESAQLRDIKTSTRVPPRLCQKVKQWCNHENDVCYFQSPVRVRIRMRWVLGYGKGGMDEYLDRRVARQLPRHGHIWPWDADTNHRPSA